MSARRTLLALVLALTACSDATWSFTSDTTGPRLESSGGSTLITKIMEAPDSVSWHGLRRIELHYTWNGAPTDLIYDESVTTDGRGHFTIETEDLIEPQLPANEEALFVLSQDQRAGFMFRHRDPMIRDEALLYQNYVVTDTGEIIQLLGRNCAHLVIQSSHGGSNTLHLYADVLNGVLLKTEEFDSSAALVMRSQYSTLTLSPNVANVVWYQPLVQEVELDLQDPQEVVQQLGFVPLQPQTLPAGFQMQSLDAVADPLEGREWARFTYTDGLEEFFFLDGGSAGNVPPHQGTFPQNDIVRYLSIGPWIAADGRLAERRVLVLGCMSIPSLKQLIESAVH